MRISDIKYCIESLFFVGLVSLVLLTDMSLTGFSMKLIRKRLPTGSTSVITECDEAWASFLLQQKSNIPVIKPAFPYLPAQPEGPVCYLGNLHPIIKAQI